MLLYNLRNDFRKLKNTRRILFRARFAFWSRFRHWSLRAIPVRRNHWPLLISRAVLSLSHRSVRLGSVGAHHHPITPTYVCFSFVLLILVLGSPLPPVIIRFFYSIINIQSTFSHNLLTTNIDTFVLSRREVFAYAPTHPPLKFKFKYLKGITSHYPKRLNNPQLVLAGGLKQPQITWLPAALTPSSLYVLFLFFRTRERLFSRAFLILRYRLFVWRGTQLRVLSLNRRLRRRYRHRLVRLRLFDRPSFGHLRRTGYAVRHNPGRLNLFYWWYRVLFMGSRPIYMVGLRLWSLMRKLFWFNLPLTGALGPLFFLYSLPLYYRRRRFSYLIGSFSRALLKILLFQKASLFVKLRDGCDRWASLIMDRPKPHITTQVPRTSLFFSLRGRRGGSCFIKLRRGFMALRLSIPRVLPWRARYLYLHHRVRWFWLRNPTTQVGRREVYACRRHYWLRGRQPLPDFAVNTQTPTQITTYITPSFFFNNFNTTPRTISNDVLLNLITPTPMTLLTSWRIVLLGGQRPARGHNVFSPLTGRYVGSYFSNYVNRFFEYFLGARVASSVNFELIARITLVEFFMLESIKSRLRPADSLFSTIFFVNEFIDLVFLALRSKNFNHLITYLNRLLKSLVIWDHKRFLVFFFSAFREQFLPYFSDTNVTGLHLVVRGKIGVGGNSRRRSMSLRLGVTSRTHTFVNTHTLNTWLNTSTGALGLRVFLYYTN